MREHQNDDRDRERFRTLADRWKRDTSHLSNVLTIIKHPAYREIVEMGEGVIPLILEDLEREPADWFPALTMLTGENPITEGIAGKVLEMSRAWIDWGRNRGYTR
jgi:hypothetical protein